jgi:hypothetical protein
MLRGGVGKVKGCVGEMGGQAFGISGMNEEKATTKIV